MIDWQASKAEWVADVLAHLIPRLTSDSRFVSADHLVSGFERSVERWRAGGEIRQAINCGNELATAAALLAELKPTDLLTYEPRLGATSKTIDFMVHAEDESREWIDVKTVAPQWNDGDKAWQRYIEVATGFPPAAQLVVSRDWCGAGIAGQEINARWSFVRRILEVEAKVASLTAQEVGPVRLLFCSAGEWHEDDLEDFADFYRTGAFREDDWAQNAITRYMAERGLSFTRSLAGFCYLRRNHDEVEAKCLHFDVRGPQCSDQVAPRTDLPGGSLGSSSAPIRTPAARWCWTH